MKTTSRKFIKSYNNKQNGNAHEISLPLHAHFNTFPVVLDNIDSQARWKPEIAIAWLPNAIII